LIVPIEILPTNRPRGIGNAVNIYIMLDNKDSVHTTILPQTVKDVNRKAVNQETGGGSFKSEKAK